MVFYSLSISKSGWKEYFSVKYWSATHRLLRPLSQLFTLPWGKTVSYEADCMPQYNGETSFSVFLTKYYSGVQIRKTEMGRACSMGEDKCIEGFGGET